MKQETILSQTSNVIVITAVFGKYFNKLHFAPKNYKCHLFSNKRELAQEAEDRGWIFEYIDFAITDDVTLNSIYSKYVKFLQFLTLPKYFDFLNKRIFYIDHKWNIKDKDVYDFTNNVKINA